MLRLIPAPERQVSKEAILEWINRHNPPVCRIVANVGDGDKDHNESSFRSLITLLSEKKMVRDGVLLSFANSCAIGLVCCVFLETNT